MRWSGYVDCAIRAVRIRRDRPFGAPVRAREECRPSGCGSELRMRSELPFGPIDIRLSPGRVPSEADAEKYRTGIAIFPVRSEKTKNI